MRPPAPAIAPIMATRRMLLEILARIPKIAPFPAWAR